MKFVKKHVFLVFRNIGKSSSLSQFQLIISEKCRLPAISFWIALTHVKTGPVFLAWS